MYMEEARKQLDKATRDKVSFITFIVPEFAAAYKMNIQDAYFYLKKYGGWDFLNKHWWALYKNKSDMWVRDTKAFAKIFPLIFFHSNILLKFAVLCRQPQVPLQYQNRVQGWEIWDYDSLRQNPTILHYMNQSASLCTNVLLMQKHNR